MQIFQWLFKCAHEQQRKTNTFSISGQNAEGKVISVLKHDERTKRIKWRKNLKTFAFVYRKDIPKAFFYSSINLKRLGSCNRREFLNSMKMKREESISQEVGNSVNKADSAAHVGNKVLPITEKIEQCDSKENKDQIKGDKKKPISRMKELLRWAASAKAEKGAKFNGRKVLMFRRRGTPKTVQDDDEFCSESPKISFRWDVESCSTTSSVYSAISMASSSRNGQNQMAPSENGHVSCRKGNWITTDSEFVVLEL